MDLNNIHYIAQGYREDVENILEDFSSRYTFDYKIFSKIWKKNLFTLIYMAREDENELSEFTQEIFIITLGYIKPSFSIYLRAGAMYVLYGLYVKQPLEYWSKIRITKEQWLDILDLFIYAKKERIKPLVFTILKLMSLNPFYCVACDKYLGPRSTMTWSLVSESTENGKSLKKSLEGCLDSFNLDDSNKIHKEYVKMADFAAKFGLDMSMYENKYESIGEDLEKLLRTESFKNYRSQIESSVENDDCIGIRRSELKMRQYKAECISKVDSRRNELLDVSDADDNDASESICGPLSEVNLGLAGPSVRKKKEVPVKKKRKPRKGERKRGRPKKNPDPSEEEVEKELEPEDTVLKMEMCDEDNDKLKPFEKPKRLRWHYENEIKFLGVYEGTK